jgi:hypothetical protein
LIRQIRVNPRRKHSNFRLNQEYFFANVRSPPQIRVTKSGEDAWHDRDRGDGENYNEFAGLAIPNPVDDQCVFAREVTLSQLKIYKSLHFSYFTANSLDPRKRSPKPLSPEG